MPSPGGSTARADDAAPLRPQAVVNLTFDEAAGDALDTAAAGSAQDNGVLVNGAARVKSPFWGQSGKQALVLDSGAKQYVQIADSPDIDRPDAVTFSLFFVNLQAPADAGFHGVAAKRDDTKNITNYGINYSNTGDAFQLYLNDGTGFKAAVYSLNAAVGRRRPVFITAVMQVGDAPAPDADEDKDDVLLRFYANGHPIKPKSASGGTVAENEVWLTDVKVANLINDVPLLLGASSPGGEHASCLIDEFSLFARALTTDEVARLFTEVAGPNAATQIAEEVKSAPPAGPEVASVSLHGLTRGHPTVVAISGTNLLPDPVLASSMPIEKQVLRPGATAERVEFEVTVPATAPAGNFPVRVQTPRGISGALSIAVDSLPQVPFAETSPDKPVTLPVAISGSLTGQQVAKVYFAGKAGQRLIVDLECKRLGAAMDPVLELRNPRGAPLNIAWGRPQYRGDTRIEATLFADGIYSVELHDLAYKAPGQNSFRLKIGDLKLIDTTFPSAVSAGAQRSVTAIGPGMDPTATLAVDMQHQFPGTVRSVGIPVETGAVGPAPSVISSGAVELIEEPPAEGKLQEIEAKFAEKQHVPIVVNGRISRHGETDKYVLHVTPGLTMNFSADSYSLHSPLEAHFEIRSQPEGNTLAISEEKSALDFAVPAGVTAIQVAISDLNHRGGSDFVYRLRITRAGHPDFSLAVGAERVSFPRDGNTVVRVDVNRAGYDGPIALALPGAPDVSVAPHEIPAGVSKAFVVFTAKSVDASPGALVRHLHLVGTSTGLDPALVRAAQAPPNSRLALLPSARADLICTLTRPAAASLELGALLPVWFRGTHPEIPVTLKLNNPELAGQAVRLTLLTTEAPRTDVDPTDPAKQRRIQIPLLRSLPEQTLLPGEVAGALKIAVPLEVVEGQIDGVIRAEFVPNPFSDSVQATIYSPSFRLPVQNAVSLQLAANILMLTGNAQSKFTGTVKRTSLFSGAVDVALVNLPAGYTAPKVTVPADQEQFEIVVSAPAVTAAADIPNIQFRVTTPSGSLLQKDTPIATKVAIGQ